MLSTLNHGEKKAEVTIAGGESLVLNKLPEIIDYYNKTKAGMDALNQLVGINSCKKKTTRFDN